MHMYILRPPSHATKDSFSYKIKLGNEAGVIQTTTRMSLDIRLRFLKQSRLYTSANTEALNVTSFYIHTHNHVKDMEGSPGKSPLQSALSCCSLLMVPSPPCIQCKLWKTNSSQ